MVACAKHVKSEIELLAPNEEWIRYVFLHYVRLSLLVLCPVGDCIELLK